MPDLITEPGQTTVASTFIGLQSYTEAQANSFFGRDHEIERLTRLVQSNTLTIVFGKSGTGKTSLLNAGVFPKLRKDYCLPFRIRLEFHENSLDLITQIKKVLKSEIDKYGFKVEAYPGKETLWEYFHSEPLWKSVTPILIFDQFEEIFTLAKKSIRFGSYELAILWEELSDLIENSIPEKLKDTFLHHKEKISYNYKTQNTKILFAFREEYLPEFESVAHKIPSIKYSRFRLMPMNGNQAYDVITRTWKKNISKGEANQIVSYLTNEIDQENYDLITIEPSLLSQVCAYIDKERINQGYQSVSAELLNKYPKDTILRSIYEEAVTAAGNAIIIPGVINGNIHQNPVKEFLEEKMITTEGYRTKYSLAAGDEPMRPGINVLEEKYFIRQDEKSVELTHDVLAPIIKTDREKRRKEIALAEERRKARRKALKWILAGLALGIIALIISLIGGAIVIKNANDKAKEIIKNAQKENTGNNSGNNQKEKSFNIDSLINVVAQLRDTIAQLRDSIALLKDTSELHNIRARLGLLIEDSVNKETIISQQQQLLLSKDNDIARLNKRIDDYKKELKITNDTIRDLRFHIRNLEATILSLKDQIRNLQAELSKKQPPVNANPNLRISIYDSTSKSIIPVTKNTIHNDTLDVYIIPLTQENKELLDNDANKSIMQNMGCNKELDNLLLKLRGNQKAIYSNGYYYFPEIIQNGKYKIKICNIFDGYYDLKLPVKKEGILWKRKNAPTVEIKPGRF